jgi:GTP-binding protein Era
MISALNGNGVNDLVKHLTKKAPEHPWMFPEDQISDAPMKLFAAEITREKLFMKLQNELPYSIAVETEKWEETAKGEIKIYQNIYTNKPNHKMIILGKNGSLIKKIGQQARVELTELLDTKVHLFLFVKIRENWTSNPYLYSEMGMELPTA